MQPRRLDRQNPFTGAHDNSSDDGGSDQNPAGTMMIMPGRTEAVSSQLNVQAMPFVPAGSLIRSALTNQSLIDAGRATYEEGPCKKKRTLYFSLEESIPMEDGPEGRLGGNKSRELFSAVTFISHHCSETLT